jgi:ribosome biogenesis GTPase A
LQWVKAGSLRILDSPGVIPFEDSEMKLGILGAKNPEKLKKPQKVALAVLKLLVEANKETLENYYNIKIEDSDEEYDVFLAIGEKRNFLLKKGEIDENRTTFQILRDWQSGKIGS